MAVEVRPVHAGVQVLVAHLHAAAAAHAGAVDHERVHAHERLDAVGLGGGGHELHHDDGTHGQHQVVIRALVDTLLQRLRHEALVAVRAVVGHDDLARGARLYLVLEKDEVLVAEAGDHVHLAAVLVQPLGLRVRDGRSQTAADDARAARALELGGVAERPREVQQRVARLQLREAHRGGAHRLEHDGDGARLRVAFVHRERDALAALVDAQHDELARPDLARYLGRAHDHAGDFRIERFYSFDGVHGFALSLLR